MFAIVDIETCGGKFEFRKGRIVDICVVIHDGLSVVDKFSTLINPECYISSMYTNIHGITNEMVADAPKFHEVAKKILEITEGKIFVAHNVGFDYGFVKDEFASLGYKYKRDTLCTVKLSRKLMPGKMSYSLGKLCSSLGIENTARHRAEGDALATAELFNLLLQIKSQHPQYKYQGVEEIMTRRIDKMKKYILDQLPESTGVYYFLNQNKEIIYIGKSNNMYQRALSHFNTSETKGKKMLNQLYQAKALETGSELVALLHEANEIKVYKPVFNRMRKDDTFTYSLDYFIDEEGIINFKIVTTEEADHPLRSFSSSIAAREHLNELIDEYILCLRYCGLTGEDSVCFNHQIKKCNGICCGEEGISIYNLRAEKVLRKYILSPANFFILDKGRNAEEKSVIMIENGHYKGYGYINHSETYTSAEEIAQVISIETYYPDADDLIRGYLKKNVGKVKIMKY